jgi:hypothetical protein
MQLIVFPLGLKTGSNMMGIEIPWTNDAGTTTNCWLVAPLISRLNMADCNDGLGCLAE